MLDLNLMRPMYFYDSESKKPKLHTVKLNDDHKSNSSKINSPK